MLESKPMALEIIVNRPYHVRHDEMNDAVLSILRAHLPKAFSHERHGFHIGSQDIQIIRIKEDGKWFSCPRCGMYKQIKEGQEA